MKQILLAAIIIFLATLLASCEKERDTIPAPLHPQMLYRDHAHRVVNISTPGGIDVNGDGPSDVWFEIFHEHDQATQTDTHSFMVSSGETSRLLVLQGSTTPVLDQGISIATQVSNGYEWKAPGRVEIARRTLIQGTGAITWQGAWKNAQHKFLAVQVTQNGAVYNGWLELSFDTATERVILFRSGISKEAGKDVVAGK